MDPNGRLKCPDNPKRSSSPSEHLREGKDPEFGTLNPQNQILEGPESPLGSQDENILEVLLFYGCDKTPLQRQLTEGRVYLVWEVPELRVH